MEEEIKELLDHLDDSQQSDIGGTDFYEGTINGRSVVLVRCGVGKVQAAITTAFLIVNYKVDAVINSGSAGGIGDGLHVGELVLSDGVAYHDANATAFGYKMGQLPQQPQIYQADKTLVDEIAHSAALTGLASKKGLIVSGDQFVSDSQEITRIKGIYPEALCCEMEGGAVAQTAYQFKVPFAVIRAMSDVGDENAGQSFDEFIIAAGRRSAQMLLNFLENA